MLPWRPQGVPRHQTPPRPQETKPSSPETEDEDSEELAAPPQYFFTSAREIYSGSSKRDALKAWDLSAKENWKGATEEERVQGALLKMEDVLNPATPQTRDRSDSNSAKKRKIDEADSNGGRVAGKGKEKALFIPEGDDEDSDDLEFQDEAGSSRKKRRISEIALENGARGKSKGKGKAREADLVISDDEDDVVIIEEAAGSSTAAKGKGKERQLSSRPSRVLKNSSDSLERRQPAPVRPRSPSPPPSPLAQLLQLLPDLLPSHAEEALASPQFGGNLDKIMDHLLSVPGGYPKVVEEKNEKEKEKEIDFADVKARQRSEGEKNSLYKRLALDQLYTDFALLPTTLIKSTYLSPEIASGYFAPAYLSLYTRSKAGEFDAQLLKTRRKPTKKITKMVPQVGADGQAVAGGKMVEVEQRDEDLEKEMEWVKNKLVAQRKEKKMKLKLEKEEQEEQERMEKLNERARKSGKAKECQCCFDNVALANTVTCAKDHIFCKECAFRNASHRIGDQQYTLPCMTECDALFPPAKYKDWLPEKLRATLERLQAEKELEMAFEGVEGFVKCPFCPFAMYIENENERLFTCLNKEECGKVSCRKCKKEGHVPLTCEEADRESRMGGVHAVEDAMAEAMIRSCPKCQLRYYKGEACNKITCSKCGTISCYICQSIVKDYTHFDQSAPGSTNGNSSKCPLWDDTEVRHFNEVEEARKKAQSTLDAKTQEYVEKLAADKPQRQAPRPLPPPVYGGAQYIPPLPFHYQYGGVPAAPALPARRGRVRQNAAQQALALQAAQFAQQQQMILQQQRQLQLALQQQQALANAVVGGYAFDAGGGAVLGNRVRFQDQPLAAAAPLPPANNAAGRRARLEAIRRRENQNQG
ncbi:hypothetical protein JCM3765_006919 [Sporobolomyces pararoseus]